MDLIYPRRALDRYGRDMTAAAAVKNNKTDPVIGRDSEIDRVVCTLCRRSKNNAVLVGAPGVGKTAIYKTRILGKTAVLRV
jgi:ATP-dependent Clp protease ATP-binding subunit ClpA